MSLNSKYNKAYYIKHKKEILKRNKNWRINNPEKKKISNDNWDKNNPEKRKLQKKRTNEKLKNEIFNHYGKKCNCKKCPFNKKGIDQSFLTIDHVNNDGYKKRYRGRQFHLKIKKQKFPNIYQVLCASCNLSKYVNKGICAHNLK